MGCFPTPIQIVGAVKSDLLSRVPGTVIQSISMVGPALSQALTHESEISKTSTPRLWLPVLVFLATLASSQVPSPTPAINSPDPNLIVQRLEDAQHQGPGSISTI
jgi:hypothetical protein